MDKQFATTIRVAVLSFLIGVLWLPSLLVAQVPGVLSISGESIEQKATESAAAYVHDRTHIYPVQDFGAAGDSSTDDREAIQDAYDLAAITSGTVFFGFPSFVDTPFNEAGQVSVCGYKVVANAEDIENGWVFMPGYGVVTKGAGQRVSINCLTPDVSLFMCMEIPIGIDEDYPELPWLAPNPLGGSHQRFEDITIASTGHGVEIGRVFDDGLGQLGLLGATGVKFIRCTIGANAPAGDFSKWAIFSALSSTNQAAYDVEVQDCVFSGSANTSNHNGIYTASHWIIHNCDFKALNVCICVPRMMFAVEIFGGRFEGLRFGVISGFSNTQVAAGPASLLEASPVNSATGFSIKGPAYFESCYCGLMTGSSHSLSFSMQSLPGAAFKKEPDGDSETSDHGGIAVYGHWHKAGGGGPTGSGYGGSYTEAAFRDDTGRSSYTHSFENVAPGYVIGGAQTGAPDPSMRGGILGGTFDNVGVTDGFTRLNGKWNVFTAISGRDGTIAQVRPKNWMIFGVPWPANADHIPYRFPRHNSYWYALGTSNGSTVAGGTLPDDEYEYVVSVTTPWGEHSDNDGSVVIDIAGAENAAGVSHDGAMPRPGLDMNNDPVPYLNYFLRLYRHRTADGSSNMWAYWNGPANKTVNWGVDDGTEWLFFDKGQMPDGFGVPPAADAEAIDRREADANYMVIVQPRWVGAVPLVQDIDKSAIGFVPRLAPVAQTAATFTNAAVQSVNTFTVVSDAITITSVAGFAREGDYCNSPHVNGAGGALSLAASFSQTALETPPLQYSSAGILIAQFTQASGVVTTADLKNLIDATHEFSATGGDSSTWTANDLGTCTFVNTTPGRDAGSTVITISSATTGTGMNGKTVTINENDSVTPTEPTATVDGSDNITVTVEDTEVTDLEYVAAAIDALDEYEAYISSTSGDGNYNPNTQAPPSVSNTAGGTADAVVGAPTVDSTVDFMIWRQ